MFTLFKREIKNFLSSLIGYIVITVFLLINGLFLWVFQMDYNILENGYSNIDGLFMLAPLVFLFLIPAITMRSFAEEKRSGTIEMLMYKTTDRFADSTCKILCRSGSCCILIIADSHLLYYCLPFGKHSW